MLRGNVELINIANDYFHWHLVCEVFKNIDSYVSQWMVKGCTVAAVKGYSC